MMMMMMMIQSLHQLLSRERKITWILSLHLQYDGWISYVFATVECCGRDSWSRTSVGFAQPLRYEGTIARQEGLPRLHSWVRIHSNVNRVPTGCLGSMIGWSTSQHVITRDNMCTSNALKHLEAQSDARGEIWMVTVTSKETTTKRI